jgi:hypothetical protein
MEKPWGHAIMRNMKTKRQLDKYEGWTHYQSDSTERDHKFLMVFVIAVLCFVWFFI